jgi:rhodanese-related sulfurtransferase
LLDERVFIDSKVPRDGRNLDVCNPDETGPTATFRATLALEVHLLHQTTIGRAKQALKPALFAFPRHQCKCPDVSVSSTIDPAVTMADLLQEYPGAQRALFRAYHIGGCSSCGFRPDETLAEVCRRNQDLPVNEVIETILQAHQADLAMQVSPAELAGRLEAGEQIPVIDVRSREEWDAVHLPQSVFLTQELMQEILTSWPKDREFVFLCHHGVRSLDAAAYFAGHGFTRVKSLQGGIDQWSVQVDPELPRYDLE